VLSLFKKNKKQTDTHQYYRTKLNHCFLENWESFENFKLYSKNDIINFDLLIFAPEYGWLSGEKISWKYNDLKKASIEKATPLQKKKSSTQLNVKDSAIRAKLQDVLSFDSTPIAHFFWMQYISEEEFDTLHPSFHELLPKDQLIFSNESCQSINAKLSSLLPELPSLLSRDKIAGALEAHQQILPHNEYLFGKRLSYKEKLFLNSPIEQMTSIEGFGRSGRTSLLVRKALQHKLENPNATLFFVSPNQLNNDLIRQEFLSLMDFAVIALDSLDLQFITPMDIKKSFNSKKISPAKKDIVLIDDFHLLDPELQNQLLSISPILRTMSTNSDTLSDAYVIENILSHSTQEQTIVPVLESWDAINDLILSTLKKYERTYSSEDYLIVFPEEQHLITFQTILANSEDISSQIVNEMFSLQYKNTDSLLLAVPPHTSGISKKIVIIAGIDETETDIYNYLLSRGTDKAIIIPYNNPNVEEIDDENHEERSGVESDIIA